MDPQETFEQQNYPIFFDYHNVCDNLPSSNYAEYLTNENTTYFAMEGKQSSYCEMCDQHFRTPVIYNRHMRSRKHALKCVRTNMDRKRSKTNENLSLLPNEVIDSLICDLKESLDEKDTFFDDIVSGECNTNADNRQLLPSFGKVFSNDGESALKPVDTQPRHNLNNNVPKIYPCSLCFRSLHSQELFDKHLQEKHFRDCEPIFYAWFYWLLFIFRLNKIRFAREMRIKLFEVFFIL